MFWKGWLNLRTNNILISLFGTFSLFYFLWHNNFTHELSNFDGRVIGIATFHYIDVAARIKAFYRAIWLAFFGFLFIHLIVSLIAKRFVKISKEIATINILSSVGIFLIIFLFFEQDVAPSLKLLLFGMAYFTLIAILKVLGWIQQELQINELAIYLLPGISIGLFICMLTETSLWFCGFSALGVSLLLCMVHQYFHHRLSQGIAIIVLFSISLPFMPVIAQEISLILNQRGISGVSPFFLLIVFILAAIFLLVFFKYRTEGKPAPEGLEIKWAAPLFLFITAIVGRYRVWHNIPFELFEVANPANSLSNTFVFNKFPVIHYLPTHLASDLIGPFLYTLLNGYSNDFAFLAYQKILEPIAILVFYKFMVMVTKKTWAALLLCLFFPFTGLLYWGLGGFVLLLVPMALYTLYLHPEKKAGYYWLSLTLLLTSVWKPDVGSIALLTILVGIIALFLTRQKTFRIKTLLISLATVFSPVIIIIGIYLFTEGFSVLSNIGQALAFFSSSPQARGRELLSQSFDHIFVTHHYIYPIIILSILLISIAKAGKIKKEETFTYISLYSLSLFYLLNFQRGLTRHTFYEGVDGFLNCMTYLIMGVYAFSLFPRRPMQGYLAFAIITSIALIGFRLSPPRNAKNHLTSAVLNTSGFSQMVFSENKINRVTTDTADLQKEIKELRLFMDENLGEDETFFDFSNNPALYYLLERNQPVYFNHFLGVSTEKLQLKAIESLENKNVPFIIFAHSPVQYWDKTDGIFNTVRFFKVAEYIYKNYTPYKMTGPYQLWKRDDFIPITTNNKYRECERPVADYQLGKLPYVWAKFDKSSSVTPVLAEWTPGCEKFWESNLSFHSTNFHSNYLDITIRNNQLIPGRAVFRYNSVNQLEFDILAQDTLEVYRLRPSVQYQWHTDTIMSLRIEADNQRVIEKVSIRKGD